MLRVKTEKQKGGDSCLTLKPQCRSPATVLKSIKARRKKKNVHLWHFDQEACTKAHARAGTSAESGMRGVKFFWQRQQRGVQSTNPTHERYCLRSVRGPRAAKFPHVHGLAGVSHTHMNAIWFHAVPTLRLWSRVCSERWAILRRMFSVSRGHSLISLGFQGFGGTAEPDVRPEGTLHLPEPGA